MSLGILYTGSSLEVLKTLDDESVQCCITSPPYYGLRDYTMCSCRKGRVQHDSSTMVGSQAGTPSEFGSADPLCDKCGGTGKITGLEQTWPDGWIGNLGNEPTPEMYIDHLVMVFREVRRVLRVDGTLWVNIGDSYAANRSYQVPSTLGGGDKHSLARKNQTSNKVPSGMKPKDLMGIPWMLAFALREDGWYLRQDIIWHKPNPMPESVTDRCTKAHEYIFLLTKNTKYYYDAGAIREPFADARKGNPGAYKSSYVNDSDGKSVRGKGGNKGDVQQGRGWHRGEELGGRNKRSVWTITTKPFKGAHFATFPQDLVEPMILAGSKEGDTILDPFSGAATTGLVALSKGRDYIGIEMNADYTAIAEMRLIGVGLDVAVV